MAAIFAVISGTAAVLGGWGLLTGTAATPGDPRIWLYVVLAAASSVYLALLAARAFRRLAREPERLLATIAPYAFEVDGDVVRFPGGPDRPEEVWPIELLEASVEGWRPPRVAAAARSLVPALGGSAGMLPPKPGDPTLVLRAAGKPTRAFAGAALAEPPLAVLRRLEAFLDGDDATAQAGLAAGAGSAADAVPGGTPEEGRLEPLRAWANPSLLYENDPRAGIAMMRAFGLRAGAICALLAAAIFLPGVYGDGIVFWGRAWLVIGALVLGAACWLVAQAVRNTLCPHPEIAAKSPEHRTVFTADDGRIVFPGRYGKAEPPWPLAETRVGVEPGRWQLLRRAPERAELVLEREGVRRAYPAWSLATLPGELAEELLARGARPLHAGAAAAGEQLESAAG